MIICKRSNDVSESYNDGSNSTKWRLLVAQNGVSMVWLKMAAVSLAQNGVGMVWLKMAAVSLAQNGGC